MVAVMLFPLGGAPIERLAYPAASDNRARIATGSPRHTPVAHAALRHVNLLTSAFALANAAGISESADTSAPM